MDDFCNFDSEYLENKFPLKMELKKVKQMLLSGDKNQVLQSVEIIKLLMRSNEPLSELIRSDIPEFLCDAVLPLDPDLISNLYYCLEVMSKHVEFFTHNHCCFAIDSLLRTLHFLMKSSCNDRSLNQSLHLLNVILEGYISHGVTPERKTIESILHLLPALVVNLMPAVINKYQIGTLILSLFELNVSRWSQEASDTLLTSFSSWFNLLNEILEYEHPMKDKLILLSFTLCQTFLKHFLSGRSSMEENETDINADLENTMIQCTTKFLICVGAPYVDNLSVSFVEKDLSCIEQFYKAVFCYYDDGVIVERNHLTSGLLETGFLQFTSRIISFADNKLRGFCLIILFHVILYLSENVFNFSEVWPSGPEDFRNEIQHGVALLTADFSQWLDALVDPLTVSSSKLAILLYLYFYSLTAKSQSSLQNIYPSIATFIHITKGIDSSVLLLKIVWFVFVITQLSFVQNSLSKTCFESTNEMVCLLETQSDLSLIYTHHPAVLYWAFSSNSNTNIQNQTVHLWLKNKTDDCKELDELIKKSQDLRFAILDVLQSGSGQVLDSAFATLKSLLGDPNADDLIDNLWFLLPRVLAKFTTDFLSAANVDYLIELSSLKTPQSVDMSKVIRIAFLLPEVLLKSDLISVVPSLSLTLKLIRLGLQTEDLRVLGVFLRHESFIGKILEGLKANIPEIRILSVNIINILWKKSGKLKKQEVRMKKTQQKIELSRDTILRVLETNCERVLSPGLDFLREVLLSGFQTSVFEVKHVDSDFVEILFFEVQSFCVKSLEEVAENCWECLSLFLKIEPFVYELVTNPLLHELVLLKLSRLPESEALKQFLTVWIDLYNIKLNNPCFERKIFGRFYAETVQKLGRKLIKNSREQDGILLKKIIESGCFRCESDSN